jgi:hypothetical protein
VVLEEILLGARHDLCALLGALQVIPEFPLEIDVRVVVARIVDAVDGEMLDPGRGPEPVHETESPRSHQLEEAGPDGREDRPLEQHRGVVIDRVHVVAVDAIAHEPVEPFSL